MMVIICTTNLLEFVWWQSLSSFYIFTTVFGFRSQMWKSPQCYEGKSAQWILCIIFARSSCPVQIGLCVGVIHMLIEFSVLFLREFFAQSRSHARWILRIVFAWSFCPVQIRLHGCYSRHMRACLYLQGVESVRYSRHMRAFLYLQGVESVR